MENLFIKEVVNGKLVEIRQLTIGDMLISGVKCRNMQEHERLAYLMCVVLTINGEKINYIEFLNSTDISLFNFVSEAFNRMCVDIKF